MTNFSSSTGPKVDLEETARLIDALERDLAQVRSGQADLEPLRADVEQLRATLASAQPHDDVHGGLAGLREKLHAASDELLADAVKTGDYIARIGRLLGM
jgi:hypothetical protein